MPKATSKQATKPVKAEVKPVANKKEVKPTVSAKKK